eukprot:XP_001693613.1 predicted protein [Chlamydomonas reinhardtii]
MLLAKTMHPCASPASARPASARYPVGLASRHHHSHSVACRATPEGPVGTSEPPASSEAPGAPPPAGTPAQPAQPKEAPRGGDGVQRWLSGRVDLPAGYRTSRRDLLKLVSLAGGAGCLWVAGTRLEAMKYASPAALMNALAPPPEVPDFPRGADWLNSAPLTLTGAPASARGSLTGRVTVLDFWTYCCINCIHVLPDLAQLEAQFAGAPVCVVGVHSAKFDNEKDRAQAGASPLRYPGKLATDLSGGRLFVSDSNNHRVVITDLAGNFIEAGLAYSPRRNTLYVADTENHATVVTLAGNGTKGRDYRGGKGGSAQPLNSPWDVALDAKEEYLYIALAGQHQIWDLELSSGLAGLCSGSGAERNQNGPTPFTTSWAQPSGLSLAGDGSNLINYYTQVLPGAPGADVTAVTAQQLLLRVLAKVYYCQQNDVCLFEQICFEVPLVLGGAAGGAASGAGGAGATSGASLRFEVVPAAQTSFVLQ